MSTATQKAIEALAPILEAADQADALGWRSDRDRDDYNPDAHLEITITVKEARQVRDALAALRTDQPNVQLPVWCDYRRKECSVHGEMIDNNWVCDNHLASAKAGQKATGRVLTDEEIRIMIGMAPITIHMDLAQCIEVVLRHARDNGYLAPQAPTSKAEQVDRITEAVYDETCEWLDKKLSDVYKERVRALLTKLFP